MLKRICRTCGKEFDGGPRAWYCPECRAERAAKHNREYKERQRTGTIRKLGSTAFCEICGKPYTVNGGLQKFCPQCATLHLKEVDNKQSLEWKRANPNKVRVANKTFVKRNNGRTRKTIWINNIRSLRIAAGLTQEQLGILVGCQQDKISKWERGDRKPSEQNLEKLASALKTDIKNLY